MKTSIVATVSAIAVVAAAFGVAVVLWLWAGFVSGVDLFKWMLSVMADVW